MNNTTKRSVVVSAILAVVLCVSLIAGATYALFTSESSVNVAVTSGKVSVVAGINQSSIELYSPTEMDFDGTITNADNAANNGHFANNGTVTVDGETIAVSGMTPGDKVSFDIVVENKSTVSVKYRTIISTVDSDGMLANGLKITINGTTYTGSTNVSVWTSLEANSSPAKVSVVIELPTTATTCQGKTLSLTYAVSAVQGNVVTEDPAKDTYYVYTPVDLAAFSSNFDTLHYNPLTKKGTYKKLAIINDIDMSGVAYDTINSTTAFALEIIGNQKTITGLSCTLISAGEANCEIAISDLTISGAHIESTAAQSLELGTAAFVGSMDANAKLSMSNCTLENSYVEGLEENARAAGLVGYVSNGTASITDCVVNNCTIKSADSASAIINNTYATTTISDCKVDGNTSIISTEVRNSSAHTAVVVGTVQDSGNVTIKNTKVADTVKVTREGTAEPIHPWVARIIKGGQLKIDGTVYAFAATVKNILLTDNGQGLQYDYHVIDEWDPLTGAADITNRVGIVINGAEHKISGLTAPLIDYMTYGVTISNLTIANSNICDYIERGGEDVYCVGAFIAYTDANDRLVKLENCHVVNSVVGNGTAKYSGGIIGYFTGSTGLDITDCSVDSNTVIKNNSEGSLGGIVGFCQAQPTQKQIIDNCSVATDNLENGKYTGSIVGTVNFGGVLEIILPEGKTFDSTCYGRIVNATIKCGDTTYTSNAAALASALQVDDETINVVLTGDINLDISLLTDYVGGSGQRRLGGADTTAINIDLNSHKLHFNTSYMSALGAKNRDAVITVKNGSLDSDYTSFGTNWNIYDLTYDDCTWKFYDVTFNKAVAVNCGAKVYMEDCTITDTNAVYGLWISAKAGDVELNRVTINMTNSDGRAIAIKDQYVEDKNLRTQINLKLTDCTFTSNKKAAVLVTNTAGAKITASGCNITNVAADSTNLVWVDNGDISKVHTESGETGYYSEYAALVTVNGGTAIVEP